MSTRPDELLNQLGELARVQHAEHAELERLCRGQPARGSSRLLGAPPATSAKSGSFGSAALARATARFSADEQLDLITSVGEALMRSSNRPPGAHEPSTTARADDAGRLERLPLLELAGTRASNDSGARAPRTAAARTRPRPRPRVLAWALPLSAAAALGLWWAGPGFGPEALPSYSLRPRDAQAEYRSAAREDGEPGGRVQPLALARAATLVIDLQPETQVRGELEVRALLRQGGRQELWPIDVERSEQGELRVKLARLRTNLGGEAELVIAVGRPDALESDDWKGAADRGRGWQRWSRTISLP